jgi:spore coat protein CotH
VGDGRGASVFDPTRVAQIELAISDADLATLEEQKGSRLGATDDDEGEYVPANLTFDGTDLGTVGIRVKGNSSRRGAGGYASPYKIDTDEFIDGTTLDGEKKLNLHLALEGEALNDYLSYAAWREFDVAASRTGWAEVTINGEKVALYTTVEQVNEGLLARYFGDGDGALYKPESPAGRLTYLGSDITAYTNLNYKGEEESNHASFLAFVDVLNNQPVTEWENVMDVDSVLTYFAGNVAVGNWDTYSMMGHNYYLYEAPDGRIAMLPWDITCRREASAESAPTTCSKTWTGSGLPTAAAASGQILEGSRQKVSSRRRGPKANSQRISSHRRAGWEGSARVKHRCTTACSRTLVPWHGIWRFSNPSSTAPARQNV